MQSGTIRRVVAGGAASGEWVVAGTLPASLEVLEIPDILEVLEVLDRLDILDKLDRLELPDNLEKL